MCKQQKKSTEGQKQTFSATDHVVALALGDNRFRRRRFRAGINDAFCSAAAAVTTTVHARVATVTVGGASRRRCRFGVKVETNKLLLDKRHIVVVLVAARTGTSSPVDRQARPRLACSRGR